MNASLKQYRKPKFEKRSSCQVCGSKITKPLVSFPGLPMTEIYIKEKVKEKLAYADQAFCLCPKCGHGQLANVIDVGLQYGNAATYHFRTSESATGRESADFFAKFVRDVACGRKFNLAIEAGCNDLYLLKQLKDLSEKSIGIDPILKGKEAEFCQGGVTAIGDFFENFNASKKADLLLCKDTLEHVAHPRQFVEKVIEKAADDALLVFQFPLLETLLLGCRFDQVFHQHLNYYSFASIEYMLKSLGYKLIDYRINKNHWGAVLIAFRKDYSKSSKNRFQKIKPADILSRYKIFKSNMELTARRLDSLKNEVVYGYGAALMLPLLAYHLKNDLSCLKCIIDDDKNKEGIYYINLPVEIRSREKIKDIQDAVVVITAIASMNNTRRIMNKLIELNPKQIILPLNII